MSKVCSLFFPQIQAVVWYSDAKNRAPVWCDIVVKVRRLCSSLYSGIVGLTVPVLQIGVGGSIGRLAAVYCIARFLADVVSPRATALTRQDRRRRAIHDYFMSFGVPIIIMACHVVYQANRFAIIRGVGCQATQYMSWPTLIMRLVWGPVFAVGGMMYSGSSLFSLVPGVADSPLHSLHCLSPHSTPSQLPSGGCGRTLGSHDDPVYSPGGAQHFLPRHWSTSRYLRRCQRH